MSTALSMSVKNRFKKRFCPDAVEASSLIHAFLDRSRHGKNLALAELWRHWDTVLGPGLASLALPMGHREATLLIAAEDHLIMQELSFLAPEILERVNAFLDEDRFQEVHFSLLGKRRSLNSPAAPDPRRAPPAPHCPDPNNLGALWDSMDPDTPLGRCYRAYVRRFGRGSGSHKG